MYNAERKRQYLFEKEKEAVFSRNLESAFNKATDREEAYNRDMCEWTSEEILDFYKSDSTTSAQTLIQLHNSLTAYAAWCLSNGLISDNQNHYLEVKSEALYQCINQYALDNVIYTREKLLGDISAFPNFSDQFIFLGLFEGIPVRDDIIGKVGINDIVDGVLTLPNGIQLQLSKELLHIINMTEEEVCYENAWSKRKEVFPYIQTGTILKPYLARGNVETDIPTICGRRIRKCIKFLGIPKGTTIKTIVESGRIHFIKEYAKDNTIPVEQMITNRKYREMHETIYGKIQNQQMYLLMYGKYLSD